jgi:hypothetical protein
VSVKHLIRHYAEMVAVMFTGMAVLAFPAGWAMRELVHDTPALMLLRMAATMTVPMVGWMLYRGHGWRANAEMSASMFGPTLAVIGLLGAGVVTDIGVLLVIEHVAMLAGMLAVMLLRPAEYTHHHGHAVLRVEAQQVSA